MAKKKRPFQIDGPQRVFPVSPPSTVPTTRATGIQPHSVLTSEGFGIRNGIPYGRNLAKAETAADERHKFDPVARERLAAATRARTGNTASTVPGS